MTHELSSSLPRVTMTAHDASGLAHAGPGYEIAVQDGDSDDAAEKRRRSKRKRRTRMRVSCRRAIASWKLKLAALLVLIVIFELVRRSHGRASSVTRNSVDGRVSHEKLSTNWTGLGDWKQDDEKPNSLNNMDMTFRRGVACLELLPDDDLIQLKLPRRSTESTLQELQYITRTSSVKSVGVAEQPMANAFAGGQTMEERARSFKVQPSMRLHCGFCDGEHEFYIDSGDKSFMAECQIVVVTCTFGGGDDLYQPIGMTKASLSQVCYVAFWDEVTMEAQAVKGQQPDLRSHRVGLWRIVLVQNLPFADQRRNGKIPKLLSHRLFPQARYSIWVDSKSQFRRDPLGVIEALLLRPKAVFAISEHGARSCLYKEGEAIVRKNKALPEEVEIQLDQYHLEGFPENAQFDGHKALAEASVILREHTPLTNLFMCNWFNEVSRFTARDQLSFPYVLVKLGAMHPSMFTVCTRRALVNSLGHTGKAKPLNTNGT